MVPEALRLAAGHQQIPSAEVERLRLPAAFGAEEELPRLSQREQGHYRLFDLLADPVAVPGDAVLAVAVEVEAGGIERNAVAAGEREPHVFEDLRAQREP